MVTRMIVKLGPHAESKFLKVWYLFLVLHVLVEQLLVHGDLVDATGVSHLGRRIEQAHFVAGRVLRLDRPSVHDLHLWAGKTDK